MLLVILRSVGALLAGTVAAGFVIQGIEMLGIVIYPPPAWLKTEDPATFARYLAEAPTAALLFVPLGVGVGPLAGAWLAARLAPGAALMHALAIGGLFLAATLYQLQQFAHPAWMWVLGLSLLALGVMIGALLARRPKLAAA